MLVTEPYADQLPVWPKEGRHILAQFDDDTVIVYQAYRPAIGRYAIEHGKFGGEFSYSRMSWIKPNFLWMMYRSGWGTKEGQEITLGLRLRRSFFESILAEAVPSTWDRNAFDTHEAWTQAVARSSVRLQWAPDHHPSGAPQERRAIQLGLRGNVLEAFGQHELLEVIDLSDFVAEQRGRMKSDGVEALMMPRERIYLPSDWALVKRLGLSSDPSANTTRVWLLRHAETATPTVFHGSESDEVLSDLGTRQALAAAEWFREHKPDVVISSKMKRAIATAAPIAAACGIPHHLEAELHERRIGALCGTSFSLYEGPWVDTLKHWTSGDTAFTTEGAESYDDLCQRLLPAWERIIEKHRGQRIVIVAHGIVCKILLLTFLPGWGPSRWHELGKVANLAVSELSLSPANVWQAHSLIEVPPPVMAVNALAADAADIKSTA